MKRRDFVSRFSGGAAAAVVLPSFLQKAFACPPAMKSADCAEVPAGADDLTAAWQSAVSVGKPLLVILVPADGGQKYQRGELWGEVLNHGSAATWAALGCVEVVCATVAALQPFHNVVVAETDLFVLIETESVPAAARAFTATVPTYEETWRRGGGGDDWQKRLDKENAISDQRIAIVGALIETAVFGATGAAARPLLAKRVAQTEAARQKRPSATVDDSASLFVQRGELLSVQQAAEQRLKVNRIRGSKWARGGGCGVDVEGDQDNVGIACGMGHTPQKSSRFLYWFAKGE